MRFVSNFCVICFCFISLSPWRKVECFFDHCNYCGSLRFVVMSCVWCVLWCVLYGFRFGMNVSKLLKSLLLLLLLAIAHWPLHTVWEGFYCADIGHDEDVPLTWLPFQLTAISECFLPCPRNCISLFFALSLSLTWSLSVCPSVALLLAMAVSSYCRLLYHNGLLLASASLQTLLLAISLPGFFHVLLLSFLCCCFWCW